MFLKVKKLTFSTKLYKYRYNKKRIEAKVCIQKFLLKISIITIVKNLKIDTIYDVKFD